MNKRVSTPKFIDNPETAKEFASRANWKDKRGDEKGATEDYRRAVELETDPRSAKEFAARAGWKYQCDDRQGAVEDYTRAIELETQTYELFELYCDRGFARAGVDDHQGAIEDFDKALEIYHDGEIPPIFLPIIYSYRASSRHELGDYQGAVDDYTMSIDISPSSKLYCDRGKAKHDLGDKEGACKDWRKALDALNKEEKWFFEKGYVEKTVSDGSKIYEDACKRVRSLIEKHCHQPGLTPES